jgi:hypothetical protein
MIPVPEHMDVDATAVLVQSTLGVLAIAISAVGIVASGYIAAKVAGRAGLTQKRQRLDALAGMTKVAADVLRSAGAEIRAAEESNSLARYDLGRFDHVMAALAAVPLWDVSPGSLVQRLIELQENLSIARDRLRGLSEQSASVLGDNFGAHFVPAVVEHADKLALAAMQASVEAKTAEQRWLRA